MHNIFVYGTLKKHFRAHSLLENHNAIFIKKAETKSNYQLYRINWFPGMVVGDVVGVGVKGEVYSVSDDCLDALDRYEGSPNLFRRATIELSDGTTALAYIFNQSFLGKELIKSGEWTDGKEDSED